MEIYKVIENQGPKTVQTLNGRTVTLGASYKPDTLFVSPQDGLMAHETIQATTVEVIERQRVELSAKHSF